MRRRVYTAAAAVSLSCVLSLPAFAAAHRSLRENGLFIFTLFPHEDDDAYGVEAYGGFAEGGCYRHGRGRQTAPPSQAGTWLPDANGFVRGSAVRRPRRMRAHGDAQP